MNINRRSFLSAAAAALVLDHERLLWVPGRKVYSIPKPQPTTIRLDVDSATLAVRPIIRVTGISIDGRKFEFDQDRCVIEPGDAINLSLSDVDSVTLLVSQVRAGIVQSVNLHYGKEK